MTDVIDEKTEVETDEDTGKSPEAEAPAEEAQAADSGAETADDDSGKTAADADDDSGATAADAGEAETGAAASDDDGDEDDEDPWAAALAEQEAAEAAKPEPVEEPAKATVRGGSADVFQPLAGAAASTTARDLDIVMNIPVSLNVELGRTKISIRQLLELAQGSVLELDGLAGDPMDILINGYLIAQGEVVVVEDRYGIRITDIITPTERVEKLNR